MNNQRSRVAQVSLLDVTTTEVIPVYLILKFDNTFLFLHKVAVFNTKVRPGKNAFTCSSVSLIQMLTEPVKKLYI